MLAAAAYFSSPPQKAYRTAEAPRELSKKRQGIEREIEALKFRKQKMPVQDYYQELEKLLVGLARPQRTDSRAGERSVKRSGLLLLWTLHSAVVVGVGQPAVWEVEAQTEIHELFYKGRYREAEKRLHSYATPVALRLRMELAERRGDRAEANRLGRVLLGLAASGSLVTSTDMVQAAVGAWQLDRWHDANELFIQATETPPVYAPLYIEWGHLYLEQYNPAEAEGIFQDAIDSPTPPSTPARWGPGAAELGLALSMQARGKPGWMELLNKVLEMDVPPPQAIAFRGTGCDSRRQLGRRRGVDSKRPRRESKLGRASGIESGRPLFPWAGAPVRENPGKAFRNQSAERRSVSSAGKPVCTPPKAGGGHPVLP